MKTKLFAAMLFIITAATVLFLPMVQGKNAKPLPIGMHPAVATAQQGNKIEVVFVLDTTGSMGGLIQAAKEKIWSIASSMASAQQAPEIKMGLVAYRDRGDAYVTKMVDLSKDLDSVYAALMGFSADGGGDTPESVNQALYEAVNRISWSQEQGVYRVVFLVGDAPAHMDYQDDVKYPVIVEQAKAKGILINTIQCGIDTHTTQEWIKRVAPLSWRHRLMLSWRSCRNSSTLPVYIMAIARLRPNRRRS